MTNVRTFEIPGLATVKLDTRYNDNPLLEIALDPDYRGDLGDVDLRQIAQSNPGPDDIYLRCNDTTAINNPDLAEFVEVMTHWDHTGDGNPDCDHIIDAIEDAFWGSREKPNEFRRPSDGIYTRAVMTLVPSAPDRHIVFSFGELRPRFRWYMYPAGAAMLALFIGLVLAQNHFAPFMHYSVVSGLQAIYGLTGWSSWIVTVMVMATIILVLRFSGRGANGSSSLSKHTYGFFNKAAVFEEQAFREGSEAWSMFGRARSCVAFGLIHMVNLIYPLATIVPLALGGALLTCVYLRTYNKTHFRRTAVLNAAVWHRLYNRMALAAMVVSLFIIIGSEVFVHLAVFVTIFGVGFVWQRFSFRPVAIRQLVPAWAR